MKNRIIDIVILVVVFFSSQMINVSRLEKKIAEIENKERYTTYVEITEYHQYQDDYMKIRFSTCFKDMITMEFVKDGFQDPLNGAKYDEELFYCGTIYVGKNILTGNKPLNKVEFVEYKIKIN